jgi:hypothetical protein
LLAIEFSGDARHHGLSTQLAVCTHFAGHARYFSGEHAELLNHGVHDSGRAKELAFQGTSVHVELYGLCQVTLGHGGNGARDFGGGTQQVFYQGVDRNFHLTPGPPAFIQLDTLAGTTPFSYGLPHPLELAGNLLVRSDNLVKGIRDFAR